MMNFTEIYSNLNEAQLNMDQLLVDHLAMAPAGTICCVHEEGIYDGLPKQDFNLSDVVIFKIIQKLHFIQSSDECQAQVRKAQYTKEN